MMQKQSGNGAKRKAEMAKERRADGQPRKSVSKTIVKTSGFLSKDDYPQPIPYLICQTLGPL